jgi:hypothetical protein
MGTWQSVVVGMAVDGGAHENGKMGYAGRVAGAERELPEASVAD